MSASAIETGNQETKATPAFGASRAVPCIPFLFLAFQACSGSQASVDRDLKELHSTVGDMSRSTAAMRSRIEELENRVLLLQDQLETQKVAGMRGGARAETIPVPSFPSSLPVVKMAPPQAPADSGDDEAADVHVETRRPGMKVEKVLPPPPAPKDIVYQQIDDDGMVVPARGSKVRVAGSEPAPRATPPKAAAREAEDSGAMGAYRDALDRYEAGQITDALEAFREFVKRHPKHPYADNAQYWVGECLYDRKEYPEARQEFLKVVSDHPDGNKVPDAMVKVGLCNQMLKRFDEARRMYDTVMLTYPDSPAAAVAMRLAGELP